MISKVIIFCVLLFCSKFVESVPHSDNLLRQRAYPASNWPVSKNAPNQQYFDTDFAQTQNGNTLTNSALQNDNTQDYYESPGRFNYDGNRYNKSPVSSQPGKDRLANFDSIAEGRRLDSFPSREAYPSRPLQPGLDNRQYRTQNWRSQNPYTGTVQEAADIPDNERPLGTPVQESYPGSVQFLQPKYVPSNRHYYEANRPYPTKDQYQYPIADSPSDKTFVANSAARSETSGAIPYERYNDEARLTGGRRYIKGSAPPTEIIYSEVAPVIATDALGDQSEDGKYIDDYRSRSDLVNSAPVPNYDGNSPVISAAENYKSVSRTSNIAPIQNKKEGPVIIKNVLSEQPQIRRYENSFRENSGWSKISRDDSIDRAPTVIIEKIEEKPDNDEYIANYETVFDLENAATIDTYAAASPTPPKLVNGGPVLISAADNLKSDSRPINDAPVNDKNEAPVKSNVPQSQSRKYSSNYRPESKQSNIPRERTPTVITEILEEKPTHDGYVTDYKSDYKSENPASANTNSRPPSAVNSRIKKGSGLMLPVEESRNIASVNDKNEAPVLINNNLPDQPQTHKHQNNYRPGPGRSHLAREDSSKGAPIPISDNLETQSEKDGYDANNGPDLRRDSAPIDKYSRGSLEPAPLIVNSGNYKDNYLGSQRDPISHPSDNTNPAQTVYQQLSSETKRYNLKNIVADPKIQQLLTANKKRYLIVHADGTVENVDDLNIDANHNSKYRLLHPNRDFDNANDSLKHVVPKPAPILLPPIVNQSKDTKDSKPSPQSDKKQPTDVSNSRPPNYINLLSSHIKPIPLTEYENLPTENDNSGIQPEEDDDLKANPPLENQTDDIEKPKPTSSTFIQPKDDKKTTLRYQKQPTDDKKLPFYEEQPEDHSNLKPKPLIDDQTEEVAKPTPIDLSVNQLKRKQKPQPETDKSPKHWFSNENQPEDGDDFKPEDDNKPKPLPASVIQPKEDKKIKPLLRYKHQSHSDKISKPLLSDDNQPEYEGDIKPENEEKSKRPSSLIQSKELKKSKRLPPYRNQPSADSSFKPSDENQPECDDDLKLEDYDQPKKPITSSVSQSKVVTKSQKPLPQYRHQPPPNENQSDDDDDYLKWEDDDKPKPFSSSLSQPKDDKKSKPLPRYKHQPITHKISIPEPTDENHPENDDDLQPEDYDKSKKSLPSSVSQSKDDKKSSKPLSRKRHQPTADSLPSNDGQTKGEDDLKSEDYDKPIKPSSSSPLKENKKSKTLPQIEKQPTDNKKSRQGDDNNNDSTEVPLDVSHPLDEKLKPLPLDANKSADEIGSTAESQEPNQQNIISTTLSPNVSDYNTSPTPIPNKHKHKRHRHSTTPTPTVETTPKLNGTSTDEIITISPIESATENVRDAWPEATTKANPVDTTNKPDATTGKPDVTPGNPDVTTGKPDATTSKPDVTTSKPDATTSKLEATTSKTYAIKDDKRDAPGGTDSDQVHCLEEIYSSTTVSPSSSNTSTEKNNDNKVKGIEDSKNNNQMIDKEAENPVNIGKNDTQTATYNSLTNTDVPAERDDNSPSVLIDVKGDKSTGDDPLKLGLSEADVVITISGSKANDTEDEIITITIEVSESADDGSLLVSIDTKNDDDSKPPKAEETKQVQPYNDVNKGKNLEIDFSNVKGEPTMWLRTTNQDFIDKLTAKNDTDFDLIWFFNIMNQPTIVREKETTFYCNGTVLIETKETSYSREDDPTPTILKTSKTVQIENYKP